ncbi:MAG: alginate export family protein, partial [Vitreimonas sp.]
MLSAAASAMAGAAYAEESSDPIAAVADGELILEARPRLETLDQQGLAEADAYTLRTRLGWKTADWRGLSGLIEIEDVRDLGGDYDDGIPPSEPFATIGDPQSTEVNRLQFAWRAGEHFTATLGRQFIDFDDGRFVDVSNSRQDARTYDAGRADLAFGALSGTYAFMTQVNNTTADFNDWEGESHLLNVTQEFSDAFHLTGFVYALDFDTPVALNQSTRHLGVRATGRIEA